MDTSESHDLHRPWLHRTVTIFRDSWNRGGPRGRFQSVGSSSEGHDAPRSSSHLGDMWNSLDRSISIGRQRLNNTHDRGSRSQFDRGPIAPRSGLICHGIEAMTPPRGIAPMTLSIRSHDRINRPQFLGQNPL